MKFEDKVILVTGGSRGIGLAIALRVAREGAKVVIAAKTELPHPKLPGTIYTAANAIRSAGGQALPLAVGIRSEERIQEAVDAAAAHFGGIDVLVNNASAISLTGTAQTSMSRFDLMMAVNVRGTYACSQACLPYLVKSANPHILTLSPPLDMQARWFAPHLAYTIAKYGMSMCVLGMAEEFRPQGIAVNALWPRTMIATAAVKMIPGVREEQCRQPEIVADAAGYILSQPSSKVTGHLLGRGGAGAGRGEGSGILCRSPGHAFAEGLVRRLSKTDS